MERTIHIATAHGVEIDRKSSVDVLGDIAGQHHLRTGEPVEIHRERYKVSRRGREVLERELVWIIDSEPAEEPSEPEPPHQEESALNGDGLDEFDEAMDRLRAYKRESGRSCMCGCGRAIQPGRRSLFIQGHDAKLKSKMIRVESGEMAFEEIGVPEDAISLFVSCQRCGARILPHPSGMGPVCRKADD